MKNRKQRVSKEIERQDLPPVEMCNPGMGKTEMKAGNLAHFFSQLDPSTSVYAIGDGRFAVHTSNADIKALENEYCEDGDCEFTHDQHLCNCDCECNDNFVDNLFKYEPNVQYGDDANISGYLSNDFESDNAKMDLDITTSVAMEQYRMIEDICEVAAAHTANMINNLVDYQNAKNKRAMIEVARVVK